MVVPLSASIQMMGAKLYKKYRVYEKALGDGGGHENGNGKSA